MSTTTAEGLACHTNLRGDAGRCGQPAELVIVGCIHEHVREVPVCPGDQAEIRAGEHLCTPCLRHATHPHWCRLYLLWRPGEPR